LLQTCQRVSRISSSSKQSSCADKNMTIPCNQHCACAYISKLHTPTPKHTTHRCQASSKSQVGGRNRRQGEESICIACPSLSQSFRQTLLEIRCEALQGWSLGCIWRAHAGMHVRVLHWLQGVRTSLCSIAAEGARYETRVQWFLQDRLIPAVYSCAYFPLHCLSLAVRVVEDDVGMELGAGERASV
jgi:hypothetical protein